VAAPQRERATPWLGALLLAVVSLLVRVPFVAGRHTPPEQLDTTTYFATADQIGAGHLFFQDMLTRGPGYSIFVLIADLLPAEREHAIAFTQHLLGIVLIVAAFLFAWRWFGTVAAWMTGILMATSPLLFVVEDDALPDFLFGGLVFAVAATLALLLVKAVPFPRVWPVVVGLLIGIAALVKPVAQVLLLAPLLTLPLAGWAWRAVVRDVALVVLGCLVVIGPWMVHGLIRYGSPSLSAQGSLTLFNRVYEVDQRPLPLDTADGRAVARAVERRPDERIHAVAFDTLYQANAHDSRDTLAAMRRLAVEGIEGYPVAYAFDSVTGIDRFVSEIRTRGGAGDPYTPRAGPLGTALPRAVWSGGTVVSIVWLVITAFGLTALAAVVLGSRERRLAAAALLVVWLLVALATVATHGGLPRYSMQLAPITWMLSVAGLTIVVETLWRAIRPRLTRPRDAEGSPAGAK
jgi:4-amino-4-deoxy-L-arabinose transferase-like glycosyltransferase